MNEPIKDAEENDELNDVKEEVESKKIFTFTWLKLGQKYMIKAHLLNPTFLELFVLSLI